MESQYDSLILIRGFIEISRSHWKQLILFCFLFQEQTLDNSFHLSPFLDYILSELFSFVDIVLHY